MQPTINRFDTQRWSDLGSEPFEKLCCDLHAVQDGIATCQLHGTRRQREFGVDHIAQTIDGRYIEVGQSKCYVDFKEEDVKKAVKPFVEHVGKWKERNVKRFILFVACDVQRTQVHDEVVIQKKRFADEGIIFELWSGRDIQRKLQPHRTIVEKYITSKEIVDVVCGSPQRDANIATEYRDQLDLNAISSQRDLLANLLSETKSEELEKFRDYYRQGQHRKAYEGVNALADRTTTRWNLLDTSTRGSILRILALYTIYLENDLAKAERLIEDAIEIDPIGNDTVVRAILAYRKNGPQKAIEILQDVNNLEVLHLHASLLIEMQKVDAAVHLLENLPEGTIRNAETNRLLAIVFLLKGDINRALEKINAAIKEKPEWLSVRITSAIIKYWSVISPCILIRIHPLIPQPISFELVKRDEDSLALLKETTKIFKSLLTNQLEDHEQHRVQLWVLASLAVNPAIQSQAEAEAYCKKLLSEDAGNPIPLRWAMSRNYNIDYKLSEDALEKAKESDFDYIGRVSALIDLKIALNKKDEALAILEKNEIFFRDSNCNDYWLFHRAQSFSVENKWAEALRIIDNILDPSIHNQAKVNILGDQYNHTGNWEPLLDHIELLYQETDDGLYLFEACKLKATLKDYEYVLDHSDSLLSKIATPIALNLVAKCAYETKRFSKCLNLIDSQVHLFEKNKLTPQLHFYRIQCLTHLGYLNRAYEEAKTMATDATSAGLLALINVQYHNGDLDGYVVNATTLLSYDDVHPINLLKVAEVLLLKDKELAVVFWRKAVKIGINEPDVVSIAVPLGHKLSLGKEMEPIMKKMHEFADRGLGGVKAISLPEVLEMHKRWGNDQAVVAENYRQGKIPVHVLSKMSGVSLINIYHGCLVSSRTEPNPLYQASVYCLHGSRTANAYKGIQTLYVDITALLLAADMGILDVIEKAFKKIHIPSRTIFFLQEELRKLLPRQPERIDDMRKVIDLHKLSALSTVQQPVLLDSNVIDDFSKAMGSKWMVMVEQAINSSGFVVDYMPLTSNDIDRMPVSIPAAINNHIIGPKELIQTLKSLKAIDDNEREESLNKLGTSVCYEGKARLPQAGSKLYLVGNMPETLASGGVLDALCQNFSVFIENDELERIEKELACLKQQEKLCHWTQQLIDRAKINLSKGIFETITRDSDLNVIDNNSEDTLSEIFTIKPDNALWSDDRFLNSYSDMNGAPILTITDVLAMLKSRKKITKSTYFEKLLHLRASNIRFIPLSKQELLYHIKRAGFDEGEIVETKELSIIRAYWAASLLDTGLQCPPQLGADKHEINYLIKSKRAIEESIIAGWEDETIENEVASARANWILINLYTGIFGVRHLMNDPDIMADRIDLIGMDISSLLTLPIILISRDIKEKDSVKTPTKRYLMWLDDSVINTRLNADPEVIPAVVAAIKSILSLNQQKITKEQNLGRVLLQRLILQFPPQLKKEFNSDVTLMRWLGLETYSAVNIGEVAFRSSDFWRAACNAIKGKKQVISPYKSESKFFIESKFSNANDNITIRISDHKNNIITEKSDPLFWFLSDDEEKKIMTLKQNRVWFECVRDDIYNIHRQVSEISDPHKRIEQIVEWRLSSPAFYYAFIEDKLRRQDISMALSDFMPPIKENYFQHYCLSLSDFNALNLTTAFKKVCEQEDIEEALSRLISVPCKIPITELSQLVTIDVATINTLLLNLEHRVHSPVSILHLIDISLYFANGSNDLLPLAKRAFDRLCSQTYREHEFKFFVTILRHCEAALSNWKECRDWPVAGKLFYIWVHASRLFNIFVHSRADTDKLCEWLRNRIMNQYIFNFDDDYKHDILDPSSVNLSCFTCHGIGVVLSQHKSEHVEYLKVNEYITDLVIAVKKGEGQNLVEAIQNPALQLNSLDSLLGGDRYEILKPIVGEELAYMFATFSLQGYVQHSITKLTENITSMPDWFFLLTIITDMPLWQESKDNLAPLLEKVDLISLYHANALETYALLPSICEQIRLQNNEELINRTLNGLIELAKEVDKQSPENLNKKVSFLIESAFRLSIYEGDSRRASKNFAELMEKLFHASNKLASESRHIIWNIITNLTADQLHGLWKLLLTARAIPH